LVDNKFIFLHYLTEMAFWLTSVAFLWGFTNPFIKRGSKGIESIRQPSALKQFLAELWFLVTNWKVRIGYKASLFTYT